MYKLEESLLLNRVEDVEILKLGFELFKNSMVKNVKTNHEKTYFQGEVTGKSQEFVKVKFNQRGFIDHTSCTCDYCKKHMGDCIHIMALIAFIVQFQNMKLEKAKREEEILKLIDYYSLREEKDKLDLLVEYRLDIFKDEKSPLARGELTIRLGESRLYLVKNMEEFFESIIKGRELYFGKGFSYDPKRHKFSEEDEKLIEFLISLYDISFILNKESIFSGKAISLSPRNMKYFLDIIPRDKLIVSYLGKKLDFSREAYKPSLKLDLKDESISIDLGEEILPISYDYSYIVTESRINSLDIDTSKNIKNILDIVLDCKDQRLLIPQKYISSFLSKVLVYIKDDLDINLSDDLKERIYIEEMKMECYFDRVKDSITGRLNFIYGDISINPFSSKDDYRNEILIRDFKREQKILEILEKGDFKVVDGGIYLDDSGKIYDLVSEIIPKLQAYGSIYYSDSFNNIRVRKPEGIFASVRYLDKIDMLELDFEIDGLKLGDIGRIIMDFEKKKRFHRLEDGSFLPLDNDIINELKEIYEDLDLGKENRLNKNMGIYLKDYLKTRDLNLFKDQRDLDHLVDSLLNYKKEEIEIPKEMQPILRDYQKTGYRWLKTMADNGLGGILADDMGLGKTLQIITLLLDEKDKNPNFKALIVVPSSLLFNWQEEIQKFAKGAFKVLLGTGRKESREEILEDLGAYNIILTSYPLIRNDVDIYKDFYFDYIILDEAQYIKNSSSLNARSVKKLKARAKFALTGTPIENGVRELWSIFDFIMPGYLLSRTGFINKFEKPIFKEDDLLALKDLNNRTRPFILRRLKKQVLKELPEKVEQKILVDMTEEQKKVYGSYLSMIRAELEEEIKEKGYNNSQIKILAGLTRLRQICCDPSLFLEDYRGGSGKLESFLEIVKEAVDGGHRILVFSQFTSMLDIIESRLNKMKVSSLYLKGTTPVSLRGSMVEEFNQGDVEVFLISLKSGGSGLNLTGADMVIHYDPWWNPAVEQQATDRAYRIGQENMVQVIKLISKGTIEEQIYRLQNQKLEVIDMVIKEGENLISKLSEEEILSLFNL